MKKLLLPLLAIYFAFGLKAQQKVDPSPILWYDIQTAEKLFKQNPKPLLIDVYTDWCKWCHYMMRTTYSNKNLASYINTYFYPVRFNAETSDTIEFLGKKWVKKGRANQLAYYLLDSQLAYPSTVFFDLHMQKYRFPGYLKIKDIEPILVYLAEDLPSQNIPVDTFRLAYMLTYPKRYEKELEQVKNNPYDTTAQLNWYNITAAYDSLQKNPRRLMLIFGYVPWCYSCKPMETINFRNKHIVRYITQHFYPVKFNAAMADTIHLGSKTFVSLGKGMPHELAVYLYNNYFRFPSLVFVNSEFKVVGKVYGFYTPQMVFKILTYFGSDAYKRQNFQQYLTGKQN